MAYTREQIMAMGMLLTKLVDTGALGPRAASTENPLLPGAVLDLLWTLMFGKSKEECDVKGGLFVLGTWKDQPVMSWHLNKINITEIISLLAVTVGMIGERAGHSVIDDMIDALNALKEKQDLEQATDEQPSN